MSRWQFVLRELAALQQGFSDDQPIVELYVQQVLLKGYKINEPVKY